MKRFKIKLSTLLSFALAIALGTALFSVSQQVQILERERRGLLEQIESKQEAMRVLNAEWDYLNRPDRIEELALRYLDKMQSVVPDNLIKNANAVPEPQILKMEDEIPILVSTDYELKKTEKKLSAQPDPRSIQDKQDLDLYDFNRVLKKTTEGESE